MATLPAVPVVSEEAVISAPPSEARIELLHLWRTPGEQAALHVFRDALLAEDVLWYDTAVQGGANGVRKQLSDLMTAEAPPSIVQWIPSEELNQLFDIGVFRPVDSIDESFADKLIPEIREVAVEGDTLRILPVGIHTYDFMAYNRNLVEELDISIPQSWADYLALGPELAKRGIPLLSVSDEDWQIMALHRAIMASYFTREDMLALAANDTDYNAYRQQLENSFETLLELRSFAAPDREDLRWEDAVARVEDGKALSIILGDYIVAAFDNVDNMICARTFESNFVPWGFDSFVFTYVDDPALEDGQARFAAAVNQENMIEYVMRKGGLPVVTGVDPSQLDRCNAGTLTAWQTADRLWEGRLQGKNPMLTMRAVVASLWKKEGMTPAEATDLVIEAMERL